MTQDLSDKLHGVVCAIFWLIVSTSRGEKITKIKEKSTGMVPILKILLKLWVPVGKKNELHKKYLNTRSLSLLRKHFKTKLFLYFKINFFVYQCVSLNQSLCDFCVAKPNFSIEVDNLDIK